MKKILLVPLIIGVFSLSCNNEVECLKKSELPETVTCDLTKNCLSKNELSQIVSCNEKLANPTKNELAADAAFQEGIALFKAGKFDEARIYFVNAINHDPNEIKYYEKLFETLKKVNPDREDLEENKAIFELGIYRVDSRHIKDLSEKFIPEIDAMIGKMSGEKESAATATETVSLEDELNKLNKELPFSKLLESRDRKKTEERLTALASMREYAESDKLENEYNKTKTLLEYVIVTETVDKYLKQADSLLGRNDEQFLASIESILQNAKVTLSQAWSIDIDALKGGNSDPAAQLNNYTKKIEEIGKKFNERKSLPAKNKYEALKASFDALGSGKTETDKLNEYKTHLKKIAELLPEVYSNELKEEIKGYAEKKAVEMQNVEKARLKAYQLWAAEQIKEALRLYKDNKVSTDGDAEKGCEKLKEVDMKLLIPEVASLYSDVLMQIGNELGWEKKSQCLSSIALANKKSLEDF